MNKAIVCLFWLLSVGCNSDKSKKNNQPNINEEASLIEETFDIILQIDQIDKEHFNLEVNFKLDSGSFIISPFSTDGFYGPTNISIEKYNSHIIEGLLLETPTSIEEFDPIIEKQVKFVRKNTTYKQKLKLIEEDDFQVSGTIWFVIEPICIPYEVVFVISHNSGKIKVNKTSTKNCLLMIF